MCFLQPQLVIQKDEALAHWCFAVHSQQAIRVRVDLALSVLLFGEVSKQ